MLWPFVSEPFQAQTAARLQEVERLLVAAETELAAALEREEGSKGSVTQKMEALKVDFFCFSSSASNLFLHSLYLLLLR